MRKLLSVLVLIFTIASIASSKAATPETSAESATIKITEANYEAVVAQHKLVVIDFWASWCPPCRAIGPHIEALAKEYDGIIAVGKCDVDKNKKLTQSFGISGIPAIFFIKNGKVVDQQVGYCEKDDLKKKFEQLKR